MEENHFIDVIVCDKIGGEVCQFEKDIVITTKGGGMHKLVTICEKSLVYKNPKLHCYALREATIKAVIEMR